MSEPMPKVKAWVVPGGRMMLRKTEEAVGFDTYCRAVVDRTLKDETNNNLRRTMFDYQGRFDRSVEDFVQKKDFGQGEEWVYCLNPGKWVHCAIGVALDIPFPWFGDLRPRSGLASIGMTLSNSPGTIDPDYRGEACAIMLNISPDPYFIRQNERIGQMLFIKSEIPEFEIVDDYEDLPQTVRATGGFGSTGRM